MTDWYNLTNVDTTNVLTFVKDINTQFTNSILGTLILLVLFFVSYISFSHYFIYKSAALNFSVAFFFVGIMSMLFYALGLVVMTVPIIIWILYAISLMFLAFQK